MTDEAGAWERMRAELNEAIAQGRRFEAMARRKGSRQTDHRGFVTATANGFGEIVDLTLSDRALEYPQQLGEVVTEAVVKARRAGRIVADRLRERHFPAAPSMDSLTAAVSEIAASDIRFDRMDYVDAPEAKNSIAEYNEFLHKLARETREFERRSLRCEIGVGAGFVETNLADSVVRIRIRPDSPGYIGAARLAQQILTAVRKASELTSRARADVFKKSLAESKTWRTMEKSGGDGG